METPLAAVRKQRHEPPYQTPRGKGFRSQFSSILSPTTPGRQLVAKELGLAGLNLVHSFQSHSLKNEMDEAEGDSADGNTSFSELEHHASLHTASDVKRVEQQLAEEKGNYNYAELTADILKSKIKAKAVEVKAKIAELSSLEEEYDVQISRMAAINKQVAKWRSMLHKSGNVHSADRMLASMILVDYDNLTPEASVNGEESEDGNAQSTFLDSTMEVASNPGVVRGIRRFTPRERDEGYFGFCRIL